MLLVATFGEFLSFNVTLLPLANDCQASGFRFPHSGIAAAGLFCGLQGGLAHVTQNGGIVYRKGPGRVEATAFPIQSRPSEARCHHRNRHGVRHRQFCRADR
jgi:hypothetical protein